MAGKFSLEIQSKHGSLADAVKAMQEYEKAAEGADDANEKLGASGPKAGEGLRKTKQGADEAEKAVGRLSKRFQEAGGSAGQFKAGVGNATQQLFDVIVSLQGGMNPLTVLIQQGPQLATSFGSISGTLTVLMGLINPLTVGLTAVGGALAYVAYEAYSDNKRLNAYTDALALMGNQSGLTAESLDKMVKQLQRATDIDSDAAEKAAIAAASRLKSQEQIQQVLKVTADTIKNTGEAADDVATRLSKAYSDPLEFMRQMGDTLGNLNPQLVDQVQHYMDIGDKVDATRVLLDAYDKKQLEIGRNAKSTADQEVTVWDRITKAIMDAVNAQDKYKPGGNTAANAGFTAILGGGRTGVDVLDMANEAQKKSTDIAQKEAAKRADLQKKEVETQGEMNRLRAQWQNEAAQAGDRANKAAEDNALRSVKLEKQKADYVRDTGKYYDSMTAAQKKNYDASLAGMNREIEAAQKAEAGHQKKDKAATAAARATAKNAQEEIGANVRLLDIQAQLKDAVEGRLKVTNEERAAAHNRNLISEYELANSRSLLSAEQKRALASMKANQGALDAAAAASHRLELQRELNKLEEKHGAQMSAAADLSKTIGMTERETAEYLQKQAQIRQRQQDNPLVAQSKIQLQVEQELAALQDARQKKDRDWLGGMKSGIEEWGSSAVKESELFKDAMSGGLQQSSDALLEFCQTGKFNLKSFVTDALKIVDQLLVKLTMMSAVDAFTGKGNGGGFLDGIMSGISGAFKFAKGGVFQDPSLHSYVNGVYDTPQPFSFQNRSMFAKGGVFGEAGPEAIMPLTRDANGQLGIKATGSTGGGGVVINEVNVHVDAGGGVTAGATPQKQDAMGRAYAQAAAAGAKQQIERELQPGGLIYQELHGHA